MKSLLKISILANLILGALIIWLVRQPRTIQNKPQQRVADDLTAVSPALPAVSDYAAAIPFRWNQLESSDFRNYIANLRSVGCPEQTIRELITAEVDDIYKARRLELQRKLAAGGTGGANFHGNLEAQQGLQHLQNEEAGVLQALLGLPQTNSLQVAADAPAPAPVTNSGIEALNKILQTAREKQEMGKPVPMPLALQPLDPQSLNLSPQELLFINEVRQEFVDDIGGTNQDPNDPAYLQRWQAALRKSDSMMSALLGPVRYQLQAQNQMAQGQ